MKNERNDFFSLVFHSFGVCPFVSVAKQMKQICFVSYSFYFQVCVTSKVTSKRTATVEVEQGSSTWGLLTPFLAPIKSSWDVASEASD